MVFNEKLNINEWENLKNKLRTKKNQCLLGSLFNLSDCSLLIVKKIIALHLVQSISVLNFAFNPVTYILGFQKDRSEKRNNKTPIESNWTSNPFSFSIREYWWTLRFCLCMLILCQLWRENWNMWNIIATVQKLDELKLLM